MESRIVLRSGTRVQECDATKLNSSNEAGYSLIFCGKNSLLSPTKCQRGVSVEKEAPFLILDHLGDGF
jgi:hypothetical protein